MQKHRTERGAAPADLHSHSTASDGTSSPSGLVLEAIAAGLETLALTDHDTVAGLPDFLAASREADFQGIGGVELSLEFPGGTMHLLGLNILGTQTIPKSLHQLQAFRAERNERLWAKLRTLGYELDRARLAEIAGGGQLGRPHFANLLVERGFFNSKDEAFDQLLAKGQPGYVERTRLSPEEGLDLFTQIGWAPVLAHPATLGLTEEQWPTFLSRWKERGLLGLEVYTPKHQPSQIIFFNKMAQRFALTASAGSDFHGDNKPGLTLDWVRRNTPPGLESLEGLRSRL